MRGQTIKRRLVSFGWRYQIYKRCLIPSTGLPRFLKLLRDRCVERVGLNTIKFDQAVIIHYPPGSGIGPHIDAQCFGPVVLGVSLASPCTMTFRRSETEVCRVVLEPRSLVAMALEARTTWRHEILPVRKKRYSILFRSKDIKGASID